MSTIDEIKALIKSGAYLPPAAAQSVPRPTMPNAGKPMRAKAPRSINDSDSDDEDENIWEPTGTTKDTINSLSYFTLNGDTWPQLKAKEKKKSLLIFFDWLDSELQKIADAEVAAADELFN